MHANFVLCLLSSSSSASSGSLDHSQHSTRPCLRSCGLCLRRFFRRLCFFIVLCIWSLSFTATIPLLYTIDSNEKNPKPVYCPGTTQISYMEEWFDRNRFAQTVIFNLSPLVITLILSLIALLKLLYDCLMYFYLRLKMSKCSPCRGKSSRHHQHDDQHLTIPNSLSMLSSLGIISNSNIPSGMSLLPITETSTPTSETSVSSTPAGLHSCGHWCSTSFLRFLLVLSCCLLACIYPIAMRFYLVYFSVLVPLIFAVLNYSLGQLTSPPQPSTAHVIMAAAEQAEQPPPATVETRPVAVPSSINCTELSSNRRFPPRHTSFKRECACVNEEYELQAPLMNNLTPDNETTDDRDRCLLSFSDSSQSSILPTTNAQLQQPRTPITGKQKYFSNNLYENYSRNSFRR